MPIVRTTNRATVFRVCAKSRDFRSERAPLASNRKNESSWIGVRTVGSSRFASFESIEMEIEGRFESRRERTNSSKDIGWFSRGRERRRHRVSRYSPGIPSTYIAAGSPHTPLPPWQSVVHTCTRTCPYIRRSYLGCSNVRSLCLAVSLSAIYAGGSRALSPTRVRVQSRSRSPSHSDLHPLTADSVERIARVTRTRVHRAAFRRVHAATVKRCERKPRARLAAAAAAAAAAARLLASEPVRLAGNRPTNATAGRAARPFDR